MLQMLAFVVLTTVNEKKLLDSVKLIMAPDSIQTEKDIIINFFGNMEIITSKGVLREQDFDFHNPDEVIYWYTLRNHMPYHEAEALKEEYKSMAPREKKPGVVYGSAPELETVEELKEYLGWLKSGVGDPLSEQSQAFQEFMTLYGRAREIIAAMYQSDEEEKEKPRTWTAEDITPSDVEKVICSGIPINSMGNLKKMSASILSRHFSQKRFSRQRITNILNHKFPVERFDLITLEFFIISQEMDEEDPYKRYHEFLVRIQEILKRCGMGEIYIVNPYECFILMCLLTDCPLAVFSEIWEKSYEEAEE